MPNHGNHSRSEIVRRHCLTALVVILFLFEVIQFLLLQSLRMPSAPRFILVVCALANVFCVIAMFRWRRWGFVGFLAATGVSIVTNTVAGLDRVPTIAGIGSIAVLYLALHAGGARSEWTYFK